MTDITQKLQTLLNAHGVNITDEETLQTWIDEALALCDNPLLEQREHEMFEPYFHDNLIILDVYPVLTAKIIINNKIITPSYISEEGIIHLSRKYSGQLTVRYTTGISESDINKYLLPITLQLILANTPEKNIASVSEGDVKVSYSTRTTDSSVTSIDALITELNNKYNAMVVLL